MQMPSVFFRRYQPRIGSGTTDSQCEVGLVQSKTPRSLQQAFEKGENT